MIHSIYAYLGQVKDAQGRVGHRHKTICKLDLITGQRLSIGALLNIGAADKRKCPTCCDHLRLQRGGPDGFAGHAGSDPSLLRVGNLVHDQSHDMDRGKAIVKVSGMEVTGLEVIQSDQDVDKSGQDRLKGYGRVNEDPVVCEDNDPFGDGEVAYTRGTTMSGNPNATCPYKNPYLARRWAEGIRRGRLGLRG
jgi:hypothetical protein